MANKSDPALRNINGYVASKLKSFSETERDFESLFEYMFSERENVMFEKSEGYRIVETTYGECRDSIFKRSAALSARLVGLPADSAVGICLPNGREWIEVFWSVLMCGRRPLLMNQRLDNKILSCAAEECGVSLIISESGEEDFGEGFTVIGLGEIEPGSESYEAGDFGKEVLIMSSGTGDHVKIAAYTAENFYWMVTDSLSIIKRCSAMKKHFDGRLKQLAFLPFSHIFGLVSVYIWFAFFSRTFVLLKGFDKDTLINTIRRHKVTHIFAVPLLWNKVYTEAVKGIRKRGEKTEKRFNRAVALYKKLSAVPPAAALFSKLAFREVRKNLFGNSIRFMISGGSEISSEVLGFFNAIGYRLANGYGMTEIGITSFEMKNDYRLLASGSVGLPFDSCEYRIENGRLFVRSSSAASRVTEGGRIIARGGEWYDTGDLAELKNGRYRILGRSDDVVISATGENLNPCLIEEGFRIDGVRECCLVGLREGGGEVRPTLVLSLKPLIGGSGAAKVFNEAKRHLSESGLENMITRILIVKEPLMDENDFKLNRRRIAEKLMNGGFTLADGERACSEASDKAADSALLTQIRGLFAEALGKDISEIAPESDFFLDLGGSSLDFFGVVSKIQHKHDIAFPVGSGRSLSNPSEIAAFIMETVNGEKN